MKLADKFRYLREVEGSLRGLGRAMTQGELLRAIAGETGNRISQSYLSQIESGARPHLTNTTRLLLARFFQVHPGYLVDDPEGYHAELLSDARVLEDKLDLWLISGAERFRGDPELSRALLTVARREDSAQCLLLLKAVLEEPRLAERLMDVLLPATPVDNNGGAPRQGKPSVAAALKDGRTELAAKPASRGRTGGKMSSAADAHAARVRRDGGSRVAKAARSTGKKFAGKKSRASERELRS